MEARFSSNFIIIIIILSSKLTLFTADKREGITNSEFESKFN